MPRINDKPQLWYRALITFRGEPPIEIFPLLTNDPDGYRRSLDLNYDAADRIDFWECDADGTPFQPAAEAAKTGETQGTLPTEEEEARPKTAERPPGMGQLFY